MKSHPCAKTGGGVPPSVDPTSQSITPFQPVTSTPATIPAHATTLTPCRYTNGRGQRCRLFSTIPDLELCPHHARQTRNRKQRHLDKSAAELLGDLENFSTPEAINFLLGNLVRQLARKRIHRRDAMAIAYVCQLLLGSISCMDRHEAAQRTATDQDEIPPRLIFDPPNGIDPTATPISDTLRLAASLGVTHQLAPENKEGRA